MSLEIFVSGATREFGELDDNPQMPSIRGKIADGLQGLNHRPTYQKRRDPPNRSSLPISGLPTPSELNRLIQRADLVVHLVGQFGGSAPTYFERERLLQELPELADRLPDLARLSPEELAKITYTDWEAWLALYHYKPLLVLAPSFRLAAAAPQGPNDVERQERVTHLQRLAALSDAYLPKHVNSIDEAVIVIAEAISQQTSPDMRDADRLEGIEHRELDHNYYGHERLAEEVREKLMRPVAAGDQRERAIALWGEPGLGKSTLLTFLQEDDVLAEAFPGGILSIKLGKDAGPGCTRLCLTRWAQVLQIPANEVTRCIDDEALRRLIRNHLAKKRTLFLVDDVWRKELGTSVKLGAATSAYVFTTRTPKIASALATPDHFAIQVHEIDVKDSLALVESIAESSFQVSAEITRHLEQVITRYAGNPLVLQTIGEFLKSCQGNPVEIQAYLRELESTKRSHLSKAHQVFAPSFERLPVDLRVGLVRLAALKAKPKSFSATLGRAVVGSADAFKELATSCGLLHKLSSVPNVYGPSSAAADTYYSMHQAVADYLLPKLGKEAAREVHRIAARHIEDCIEQGDRERSQDSDYDAWYRVEDPSWHAAMFDLQHYLLQAAEYEKLAFVLTQAWLCGFWWWDCYTKTDSFFCTELIKNWPQLEEPEAKVLAEARKDLEIIGTRYPMESDPERTVDQDRWLQVRHALERVRERHGLAGEPTQLTNQQNDFLGLLDIFMAETYRFAERDEARALQHYRAAVSRFATGFQDDPECWNLNWSQWHLADALCEFGHGDEGDALAESVLAEEKARRSPDHEVISRASLTRATQSLHLEQVPETAEFLHAAVYSAYRFQVFKAYRANSATAEPDGYTLDNYQDIAEQAAELLLAPERRKTALDVALLLEQRWRTGPSRETQVRSLLGDFDHPHAKVSLAQALFPQPLAAHERTELQARQLYESQVRTLLNCIPAPSWLPL